MNKKWAALGAAVVLAASLAGCGGSAMPASKQARSGPVKETMKPFDVRQVVAKDNTKGRTVMWEMPSASEESLEYREQGSESIYTVPAT